MPRGDKALTLSIIIPAYNEENYLNGCLESIAAQTVMPNEVIVVDNNSNDHTTAVAARFPFVTILKQNKQGIALARNLGFNDAKGDIIGRIDADTRLPINWVERVLKFYNNPANKNAALTGGGYLYNIRAKRLNSWVQSQLAYRVNRFIIGHNILWGSNMALPKNLWEDAGSKVCSRQDIHEDMDIAIHLHDLGYQIIYHPSLKVGVALKRVYSGRSELSGYMARWPRTLRVHGYRLWWMGSLGNIFLRWIIQPIVFVTEYFSQYVLRRKSLR